LLAVFGYQERVGAQGSAGAISFSQANYNVSENGGPAAITLQRTGGSTGPVTAKVNLADVTTSPADYSFTPGSVDLSFAQPSEMFNSTLGSRQAIALQPDGKVLVCTQGLLRFNANGTRDPFFNVPVLNGTAEVVALTSIGKIIIGGGFTSIAARQERCRSAEFGWLAGNIFMWNRCVILRACHSLTGRS
jgi:hypothetical protein